MRPKSWGVLSILACMVFTVSMAASASAKDALFVVSASLNGDANYMISNGDGTFSPQQTLQLTSNSNISLPFKYSYGNGLGDFDNDGDLDYIMAMGFKTGNIYLSENTGSGYQFEKPVCAASWGEEGDFPGGLAVADFDEDGHADFVMALLKSTATMLYLGDGALGFKPFILYSSAPSISYGIDAADFNNDGHADFIVAPGAPDQFFVNLGKGDGTFDTYTFNTVDGGAVYGVAAADFDGDGNADIAASDSDILYIYKGTGDGKTFEFLNSYAFELNLSALDNYDFNGDGKQDLVAADYGSESAGVAVLLGNGDGTFSFGGVYAGGTSSARNTVAGPPYEPNREPVAVIEPAFQDVTVGEEIVFDGAFSEDADGEIVAYEWDFGDAAPPDSPELSIMAAPSAGKSSEAKPTHIYYKAGTYTVNLTVIDDKGATNSVQAEVNVKPLAVKVWFSPRKLNLKSRDKWIQATIKLPDGLDAAQINRSSVSLATVTSSPIPAHQEFQRRFLAKLWSKIQRRMNIISVKFDRLKVIKAIDGPADAVVLTVRGEVLHNGGLLEFKGSGIIKAFEKQKRWGLGFPMLHFSKTSSKNVRYCAKIR
jgi:PKD domain/FG-GAP-like repeat